MRLPWMVLLALAACHRAPSPAESGEGGAAAGASASAAGATSPHASASDGGPVDWRKPVPAERVPDEYGRYYIDAERFSAIFPVSPTVTPIKPLWTAVDAPTDSGDFEVLCTGIIGDGEEFKRAHDQAAGDGQLLSDSHPDFFGTEAYQTRVKRKDGGLRVMRFVRYAHRFCSISAELNDGKDESPATRFIESFRPERAIP